MPRILLLIIHIRILLSRLRFVLGHPFPPKKCILVFNNEKHPRLCRPTRAHSNLKSLFPGVVAALVHTIEGLNVKPCNLPGGSCAKQDVCGLLQAGGRVGVEAEGER